MPKGIYLRTAEARINLSKSHKGIKRWSKKQEEQLSSLHEIRRGVPLSEETKKKISESRKGQEVSEETRKKLSESQMGHAPTTKKGMVMPIGHGLHISQARRGICFTQSHKDADSMSLKKLWQNPEYKAKQSRAMRLGEHAILNKPESLLMKLANVACPNEYQFTGDGTITIDGLSPDLFNINNKKKVILMHGDYWHKNEDTQVVINRYFEFGYDCLVIWEKELEDYENIIAKIREFNNRVRIHHPEAIPVTNKQSNMFDILGNAPRRED